MLKNLVIVGLVAIEIVVVTDGPCWFPFCAFG